MLTIPGCMIVFGGQAITLAYLSEIYIKWTYIILGAQFLFGSIFLNRGHHGTNLWHQNDGIKSFDFGEFQLSTTVDRSEANANTFTSMAYFGDQVIHHLFPTLDVALLPQLKDTFLKTCKEFDIKLKPEISMIRSTWEQFKQLYRSEIVLK
jgi:fatty acid desaturase